MSRVRAHQRNGHPVRAHDRQNKRYTGPSYCQNCWREEHEGPCESLQEQHDRNNEERARNILDNWTTEW